MPKQDARSFVNLSKTGLYQLNHAPIVSTNNLDSIGNLLFLAVDRFSGFISPLLKYANKSSIGEESKL